MFVVINEDLVRDARSRRWRVEKEGRRKEDGIYGWREEERKEQIREKEANTVIHLPQDCIYDIRCPQALLILEAWCDDLDCTRSSIYFFGVVYTVLEGLFNRRCELTVWLHIVRCFHGLWVIIL